VLRGEALPNTLILCGFFIISQDGFYRVSERLPG